MQPIAMRELVRRLLTQEALGGEGQESLILSADRVLDKLRVHLSTRIGQEGFRTLLSRALALTTARHPHLSLVRVEASGALAGLQEAAGANPQATAAAAEALVAHLLELLVTFIGEDLTTRLLSAVWPEPAREEPTREEPTREEPTGDGLAGDGLAGDGLAGVGATGGESDTL